MNVCVPCQFWETSASIQKFQLRVSETLGNWFTKKKHVYYAGVCCNYLPSGKASLALLDPTFTGLAHSIKFTYCSTYSPAMISQAPQVLWFYDFTKEASQKNLWLEVVGMVLSYIMSSIMQHQHRIWSFEACEYASSFWYIASLAGT